MSIIDALLGGLNSGGDMLAGGGGAPFDTQQMAPYDPGKADPMKLLGDLSGGMGQYLPDPFGQQSQDTGGGFSFAGLIRGALQGLPGAAGAKDTMEAFAGGYKSAQEQQQLAMQQAYQQQQMEYQRKLQEMNLAKTNMDVVKSARELADYPDDHQAAVQLRNLQVANQYKALGFQVDAILSPDAVDGYLAGHQQAGGTLSHDAQGMAITPVVVGDKTWIFKYNPDDKFGPDDRIQMGTNKDGSPAYMELNDVPKSALPSIIQMFSKQNDEALRMIHDKALDNYRTGNDLWLAQKKEDIARETKRLFPPQTGGDSPGWFNAMISASQAQGNLINQSRTQLRQQIEAYPKLNRLTPDELKKDKTFQDMLAAYSQLDTQHNTIIGEIQSQVDTASKLQQHLPDTMNPTGAYNSPFSNTTKFEPGQRYPVPGTNGTAIVNKVVNGQPVWRSGSYQE